MHRHDKPAKLDSKLLAHATTMATRLKGSIHAAHALNPDDSADPTMQKRVAARFHRRASSAGVSSRRQHLLTGPPVEAIATCVREHPIDLLVMRAVSRSALKTLFLGHTAQDVIDQVSCDLLVVLS